MACVTRFLQRVLGAAMAAAISGPALAAVLPPIGLWQGHYRCAQGDTAFALQVTADGPEQVRAVFYFHALTANPAVPQGCFSMRGRFDPATRRIALRPTRWLAQPPGYVWVGLSGLVVSGGSRIAGTIEGPACTDFALARSLAPPVPPAPSACRLEQNGPTV